MRLKRDTRAFTLIELLVVIGIIGVLAGLLLTAIAATKEKALRQLTTMEMKSINAAIGGYGAEYSRFPASPAAFSSLNPDAADPMACTDFTFGMRNVPNPPGVFSIENAGQRVGYTYQADNSEVMAVLLDLERFGNGTATLNLGHIRNAQGTVFLDAKIVSGTNSPGVGPDGVYRDPWSNPYMMTIDLNGDNKCRDAFYRKSRVSQITPGEAKGFNGLFNNATASGNSDAYEATTRAMIWSLGPDGMANPNVPANSGANRDNILTWK